MKRKIFTLFMTPASGFLAFVLDQLRDLGPLRSRAMFGCQGLSCDGRFFGVAHQGRLYFLTSDATRPDYLARNMGPFFYSERQTLRSYYEVPPEVVEDAAQLTQWAQKALQAREEASP